MANQNVLQLTQQTGSADPSSVLYAVKGGNTDTGLPLSVLFTSANLITPTTTNGTFTHPQIVNPVIAGGSADNISIGGLTPGAGSFTTLSATGTVSGAGFTTLLAPYGLLSGNLSQFASTTSAQLASKISDETGTGALVFGTSPTLTTPNITGVTNGSNATAGSVGEYVTNSVSGAAYTTGTTVNGTSISLTAGDWDVSGTLAIHATTSATGMNFGIGTVSGGLVTTLGAYTALQLAAQVAQVASTPTVRFNITTTTPIFLVLNCGGTGTMTFDALLRARRVR